jgi:hypothetical protein
MEVWINDSYAGVRAWYPFELDITELLNPGENTIRIKITNTLANAYANNKKNYPSGENWGKILNSGLLESVKIKIFEPQQFAFGR